MIMKYSLLFLSIVYTVNCFMMMSSVDYLRSLEKYKNPIIIPSISKKVYRSNDILNLPSVNIDTIVFNIYKFENIYFNLRNKDVTLRLRNSMEKIYYIDNDSFISRISNNTNITSSKIKMLIAIDFDDDDDIDCILYNSQTI